MLTDAEIEPDPIVEPHLCDHCGECVKACPGHALSKEGKLDRWQCAAYYIGANMHYNPFMPAEFLAGDPDRLPPMKHSYPASICGKACDTACYIHLERKGVLKRKFRTPFRKREAWKLSLLSEPK